MQGLDLAGDLAERSVVDRLLFAEEDHEGNVLRAVRSEGWKWIEANEGNPRGLPVEELFEVGRDPGESRDLNAERPDWAQRLREHGNAQLLLAEKGKVGEASTAQVSASERAYLEALGYVEDGEEEE